MMKCNICKFETAVYENEHDKVEHEMMQHLDTHSKYELMISLITELRK